MSPELEQNLLDQIALHKKQEQTLREEIKCLYEVIGTYQQELEGLKNIKMDQMKMLNVFTCTDCNFSRDTDINGNIMSEEVFCTKSARCETIDYCCNRFESKRY